MNAVFFKKDDIYTNLRLLTDNYGNSMGTATRDTQDKMVKSSRSMLYNEKTRARRFKLLGESTSVIYSEVFFADPVIEERQYLTMLVNKTEAEIYGEHLSAEDLEYIVKRKLEEVEKATPEHYSNTKEKIKNQEREKVINIEKALNKLRQRILEL